MGALVGGRIGLLRHRELVIIPPDPESHVVSRDLVPAEHFRRAQPLCQFSRDGARLYIGRAREVSVLNGTDGSLVASTVLPSEVLGFSESTGGDRLCIGCSDGELVEFNWASGQQTSYAGHAGPVTDCVYASNHHMVSIGQDGTVRVWESGASQPRSIFPTEASLSAFALSPVDNRLIAGSIHGDVQFLVLEGLKEAPEGEPPAAGELPAAPELLRRLVGTAAVSDHLALELANVTHSVSRALAHVFIAHLLEPIDGDVARRLRADAPRVSSGPGGAYGRVLFGSPAETLESAAEVERKVFGPGEVIEQIRRSFAAWPGSSTRWRRTISSTRSMSRSASPGPTTG